MGINFPSSPSAGQKFWSGKTLYTFSGGVWRSSNPTALRANLLVNPAFQISQEQGNNFGNTNVFYPADQWTIRFVGTQGGAIQRFATTDPTLAPYYLQFYAPTAKASLATGEYIFLHQFIEGVRMRELQWGTAAAEPVVARFTAWTALPGTYAFSIRNSPASRSYVVPIALTGTQTDFELAIPGDTTGTWYDANAINAAAMQWSITGASGATFLTASPNSWQAGNFLGQTGMANLAASAVQVIVVGRAGLYADPDGTGRAPPWEAPLGERQVMQECQRYWNRAMIGRGVVQSTLQTVRIGTLHPAQMRIDPALGIGGTPGIYDGSVVPNITSISAQTSTEIAFEANLVPASAMTVGRAAFMPNNTQANYIACNARM